MKTIIWTLTFISCSVFAEGYKPPKVQKLHWDKVKKATVKSDTWVSDYSIQEYRNPHDADEANSQERKPSSGDESAKPKFWDFKQVK